MGDGGGLTVNLTSAVTLGRRVTTIGSVVLSSALKSKLLLERLVVADISTVQSPEVTVTVLFGRLGSLGGSTSMLVGSTPSSTRPGEARLARSQLSEPSA